MKSVLNEEMPCWVMFNWLFFISHRDIVSMVFMSLTS